MAIRNLTELFLVIVFGKIVMTSLSHACLDRVLINCALAIVAYVPQFGTLIIVI